MSDIKAAFVRNLFSYTLRARDGLCHYSTTDYSCIGLRDGPFTETCVGLERAELGAIDDDNHGAQPRSIDARCCLRVIRGADHLQR